MSTENDREFFIYDRDDNSKVMRFDVSSLTTGTLSALTVPTLAGQNPDTGAIVTIGTLELDETLTGTKAFDDVNSGGAPMVARLNILGDNTRFLSVLDVAANHALFLNLPAAGLPTANRDQAFPDSDGQIIVRPGVVDATAQTANITSTTLVSRAGMYRISYLVETTTADVTAGTVTATFGWTDDVGATTKASTALTLAVTGRTNPATDSSFEAYLASGNLTYSTTHTGSYGTAQYALRVRAEFLG